MTQDQIILLLDLKDSKERGAASMSCGQRASIAASCVENGWVDETSFGYSINEKGLNALARTGRKVK